MGLSEVADFARKFSVMVKVQGSDPKGLKMRNHAFHHYNSGITTLSASGTLLLGSCERATKTSGATVKSMETVLVLTVASVIEPFVMQQYREKNILEEKPRLVPGVKIDILLEDKTLVEGNREALPWVSAELLRLVDIPQSSTAIQSLIEASCASLESGWEVGWSLASHSRGSQHTMGTSSAEVEQSSSQNQWPVSGVELSNPTVMGWSTSRIAVLGITSKCSMDSLELQTCIPKRGDTVLAMGSPFGILSPLHFFNNISVGSISNSYPPETSTRSLLMADIRCLPGMEGSPVFNENAQFVGLLTRPLRQKISGTEIQLVIPWEAIASACSDFLERHFTRKGINYDDGALSTIVNMSVKDCTNETVNLPEQTSPCYEIPSPVEKAMRSICLITTEDGSWASGILLNKQGLVLTNAHLLEPWRFGKTALDVGRNETKVEVGTFHGVKATPNLLPRNRKSVDISSPHEIPISRRSSGKISHINIRVRLDSTDPWMWAGASVVYISKGPLDIALLQLKVVPNQLCPIVVDFDRPSPGSKVYVIGHGLFGPRCELLPSACLGVISKVIEAKRSPKIGTNNFETFPAMLETTAAVHPGGSGGSVVNSDGCMIGLITSNAKHGGGTIIPHLNFSIPAAALEPILKFSQDMQDVTILEELDKPNEHLSSVWALMPPLHPKPESLLPEVPQFPAEDKSKGTKGSRFAKFMAERSELLKKTAQPGAARRFTDEVIHSKL